MADSGASDIRIDSVGQTACPRCHKRVDVSGVAAMTMIDCDSCGATFAAPGRVGEIVLLKVLSTSPTGITYKGFEAPLRRHVAVKVMRRDFSDDKQLAAAFRAETRTLAALTHPNVARTFSMGIEKGHPYIVMELVEGARLTVLLSGGKVLQEPRSLRIGIGVAEALQAADRAGLVHGEVRPSSIVIRKDDQPKLVDFGISRLLGGDSGDDGNRIMPHYASPQQSRGEAIDLRSDIYSLGATLYHALAGCPPFPGQTRAEVLQARRQGPPRDLRAIRSSLRRETAEVVARMLRAAPAQRHDDYDSLLADLHRALSASCRPPAKPTRRRDRGSRALAALVEARAGQPPVEAEMPPAAIPVDAPPPAVAIQATEAIVKAVESHPELSRTMTILLLAAVLAVIAVGGVIGMWYLMTVELGDGDADDKAEKTLLEHLWTGPPIPPGSAEPAPSEFVGRIGVGTWQTRAEFKDVRVVRAGRELFASQFRGGAAPWRPRGGQWKAVDGVYRQSAGHPGAVALAGDAKWSDYTLTLKVRKISGKEGFLVLFRVRSPHDYYWWNIGGWGNTAYGIERRQGQEMVVVGKRVPGSVRAGQWYDVRVELSGPQVRCYLDGRLIHDRTIE